MGDITTRLKGQIDLDPTLSPKIKAELARAEMGMAKVLTEALVKYYPGYMWGVAVNGLTGCAYVQLPALMRQDQVFLLHLDKIQNVSDIEYWMRVSGGEILERLRLDRGQIDKDQYMAVRDARRIIGLDEKFPEV